MKKSLLLLPLLLIGWFTVAENGFPEFPMTIYWDIKVWTTNLAWGTLKVYNSSNTELASFNITTAWKYWADIATEVHLLLNQFDWNLTFKASYNWKNYIVDSIDDSNKWEWCPSKDSITFVSADCRYDITLKEEASSTPSNPWGWWGWGGWWWGWWGWWGWGSDTPKTPTVKTWATVNTWTTTVNTWTNNTGPETAETQPTTNTDNSWYQEGNQQEVLSNGYSREFNNAYTFAYKNWITTMNSIDKANMNWPLNRIAMAKMLSQYAINVLGKKPANVVVPNFPDVSAQLNEDYGWAVTLAYQLGIMWLNIEKFRPYDEVTRAEFGTALSRMLYWLKDGNPYYLPHLAKLKAEWIIANDNPNLKELRGYVMLMLMRSAM